MSKDKLNAVANFFQGLLADNKKKPKKAPPVEGSDEEEAQENPSEEAAEDSPAAKTQKSMRKSFGGQKEPK